MFVKDFLSKETGGSTSILPFNFSVTSKSWDIDVLHCQCKPLTPSGMSSWFIKWNISSRYREILIDIAISRTLRSISLPSAKLKCNSTRWCSFIKLSREDANSVTEECLSLCSMTMRCDYRYELAFVWRLFFSIQLPQLTVNCDVKHLNRKSYIWYTKSHGLSNI